MIDPANHFLPYQLDWINDDAPVAIGEKSRRIGWTYASAFRAVDRRLRLGTNLYFTSADLSAAREFIEYCQTWAHLWGAVAEDLGSGAMDDADLDGALVLRFKSNGSLIVAGSSNPKFFRSKGGDADADEFAFHRDPRELYKAMQPAALVWGHQMRLWSTHNGEGSFFNQLVRGARIEGSHAPLAQGTEPDSVSPIRTEGSGSSCAGPDSGLRPESDRHGPAPSPARGTGPTLQVARTHPLVHRVTLLDAINQGLVEKIKRLDAPDAVARRDFIEEIRASCPDEDAWNEEYLCRPSSEQAALLNYGLIQACEGGSGFGVQGSGGEGDFPLPLNPEPRTLNPLYAGFDVGRKHDRSVLWVLERVGDVLWTRGLRVLENVNFTAQEELLSAFLKNRTVRRLCIDSTGIGAMLAERLVQRFGHRVEAVHFTAPVKSDLAMPLLRLFQDRLVRIPADPLVREDLHKVRKIVTASNNVRLEADRDDRTGHADRFWALALACHAAGDARERLPAPVMRKPLGW
jgi:phage FluMu gp28-like protein